MLRIIVKKNAKMRGGKSATNKSNTIYYYASFLGREYNRVYTTKFDKEARVVIITRLA